MITQKQGIEIARLINTIGVSRKYFAEYDAAGDREKAWLWLDSEYIAATKLVNMGIPVVGYKELGEHLNQLRILLAHRKESKGD